MIPKFIHHIWIGTKPFPSDYIKFLTKWRLLYPDYNFIFWDNQLVESTDILSSDIEQYYYGDYNIGLKADLLRFKILEKSDLDLYTGTGVFYEMEQWNFGGVNDIDTSLFPGTVSRNIFRLNHYWKGAYKINDNIDISGVSYFQLPINSEVTNLRWFFDLNTNVKMTKNLSFVIHYDGTYDNYRLVPIAKYYYSLNFGIQLKW